MALTLFLTQAFIISLSGVMQPGPISATAITHGAKNRYAGIMIAIGHGIIELPLMIVIMLGMDAIFKMPPVKITIGLFGGVILMIMAWQMFKESGLRLLQVSGLRLITLLSLLPLRR